MSIFRLIGFINPVGCYPSVVQPVGWVEGSGICLVLADAKGCRFKPMAPRARYNSIPAVADFDPSATGIFARAADETTFFSLALEAEFVESELRSSLAFLWDPFACLSLARNAHCGRAVESRLLWRCALSLRRNSPGFLEPFRIREGIGLPTTGGEEVGNETQAVKPLPRSLGRLTDLTRIMNRARNAPTPLSDILLEMRDPVETTRGAAGPSFRPAATPGGVAFLESLIEWFRDPRLGTLRVVSGPAGCGKSFWLHNIMGAMTKSDPVMVPMDLRRLVHREHEPEDIEAYMAFLISRALVEQNDARVDQTTVLRLNENVGTLYETMSPLPHRKGPPVVVIDNADNLSWATFRRLFLWSEHQSHTGTLRFIWVVREGRVMAEFPPESRWPKWASHIRFPACSPGEVAARTLSDAASERPFVRRADAKTWDRLVGALGRESRGGFRTILDDLAYGSVRRALVLLAEVLDTCASDELWSHEFGQEAFSTSDTTAEETLLLLIALKRGILPNIFGFGIGSNDGGTLLPLRLMRMLEPERTRLMPKAWVWPRSASRDLMFMRSDVAFDCVSRFGYFSEAIEEGVRTFRGLGADNYIHGFDDRRGGPAYGGRRLASLLEKWVQHPLYFTAAALQAVATNPPALGSVSRAVSAMLEDLLADEVRQVETFFRAWGHAGKEELGTRQAYYLLTGGGLESTHVFRRMTILGELSEGIWREARVFDAVRCQLERAMHTEKKLGLAS